jgi:hypothetical protein
MYIMDIHYVKSHKTPHKNHQYPPPDSLDDALENLLSGTTSVLLESLDDALENPGVRPLPRKIEI